MSNSYHQKLDALLDAELREADREAFASMRKSKSLTEKQRRYIDDVYERLELDAEVGSANLISSGVVKVTPQERAMRFPYERMPKPLRPPGR